jgi:hypothetical protein
MSPRIADWLSREVTEALAWDTAPGYLLRDHNASDKPKNQI